jgi:hypothetical protein
MERNLLSLDFTSLWSVILQQIPSFDIQKTVSYCFSSSISLLIPFVGWYPNAAELWMCLNKTLYGAEWISLGNPSNDSITFNSQSSYILPYKQKDGETFLIYMGDRWNYSGKSVARSFSFSFSGTTRMI